MNKVYIVTSGEYSDYHICAIFASRDKAEAYIKAKNDAERTEYEHDEWDVSTTKYNIEEWDLGDNYVNVAYWKVYGFIRTSLAFEKQSAHIYVWNANGVDNHIVNDVSNSIKTILSINNYGVYYKIAITHYIPKSRFATEQEVKNHYEKVMYDLLTKVKYMVEVEGMTMKEVEDSINEKESNE